MRFEMGNQQVSINGVGVLFEISISINTVTTQKPTEFASNYFKTLADMSGKHFSQQLGEAMIERINEDFDKYPKEELWEFKKEVKI